jgi:predicted aminopeptidase
MNKLIFPGLLLFGLICFQGCYLIDQGVGQFRLRFNQIPLEEAIAAEENKSYKQLLAAIPAAKQYAVSELHLKSDDNYTGYYATPGEGVAYVVTACPKTELKPYTWWFPVIGSVPYKGYFDREDALALESRLKKEGFDTWMFAAPAYSTLGWFKDPVTTPMLKRGRFSLTSTIIHEMVHGTLYINGQGNFNEQLATFIEQKGVLAYYRQEGLMTRDLLLKVSANRKNRIMFRAVVHSYLLLLNELYESEMATDAVLIKRQEIFDGLKNELNLLYPDKPASTFRFNNARLLQYKRYDGNSEFLQGIWEKSGENWERFWELTRNYVQKQGWSS